ncbi:MAG TPA: sulfatase [Terriglobales bacterium]|nr:sulfatase [Terriglobales bacterium]
MPIDSVSSAPRAQILSAASPRALNLFLTACWFALLAGLVEGAGLLVFQRINWAQWARVLHVSKEILWVSPAVDLIFYVLIACVVTLVSSVLQRIPSLRVLVFVLAFLTAYDWLLVTGRLYKRACLLLALGVAVAFVRWLTKHEASVVRFWKRSTPVLLCGLLALLIGIEGGTRLRESYATSHLPTAASGSPNILLIVIDTLRADHVSSYGYSRQTTPQIDKLASHGVLFENAIAPSSWSLPSHASLITGRPVHEHGIGNIQPMPWLGWRHHALNGFLTLGEALQQRGYRTAAFSANRIYFTSNVGLGRGFLHFEDYFDSVGDAFVRTEFGREFARLYLNRSAKSKFTRFFRWVGLSPWLDKDSEGSGEYGGAFGVRKRADELNKEALRWIERDRRHPFFAFLTYLDVHYSYGGPIEFPKPAWDHGTVPDEYDAGLQYEDDYIGRLLADLDRRGILNNTVVILTSDHGESLGDHGLSYHGAALYWELVHVPLIFSWPGHLPQGVRIEPPVGNDAIAATILQMLGGRSDFSAAPLSEFWQPPASQNHSAIPVPLVISELPQTNTIVKQDRVMQGKEPLATDGWMRSLVTAPWQLISHEKYGDQIYNWKSDPSELKNLINTPEGQAALARMKPVERK